MPGATGGLSASAKHVALPNFHWQKIVHGALEQLTRLIAMSRHKVHPVMAQLMDMRERAVLAVRSRSIDGGGE